MRPVISNLVILSLFFQNYSGKFTMGQTESFDSFPEALKHYRDSIGRQAKIYKIMLLLSRKEFYHKLSHFNRLYEFFICSFISCFPSF